jgi:hypothetical protein
MARRERSLTRTLLCIMGIRHTLMLPGIDADMREFGQSGIKCHERELLEANRDEIDTLLTTLKLRGEPCEAETNASIFLKSEARHSGSRQAIVLDQIVVHEALRRRERKTII